MIGTRLDRYVLVDPFDQPFEPIGVDSWNKLGRFWRTDDVVA